MGVEEGVLQEEGAMPVSRSCFGIRTSVEALGAGSYSPLLQQELHFQLLHALQGEEETAVVSCVSTSLQTRILATLGDPADMSMSVPLGGPAVLEWGQLLLALFVLLVSLGLQVFLSGTSLTTQRRSGYEADPQPQQVNPFAPEHVHTLPSASFILLLSQQAHCLEQGTAEMLPPASPTLKARAPCFHLLLCISCCVTSGSHDLMGP